MPKYRKGPDEPTPKDEQTKHPGFAISTSDHAQQIMVWNDEVLRDSILDFLNAEEKE